MESKYTSKDLRRFNKLKKEYARKTIKSFFNALKNLIVLVIVILYEKFNVHHALVSFCCMILGIWGIYAVVYYIKEFHFNFIEYEYCRKEACKAEKHLGID